MANDTSWRNYMETLSVSLALCEENLDPHKEMVMQTFDFFPLLLV